MKEIRRIVKPVNPENESAETHDEEINLKELLDVFDSEPLYFQQVIRPMLSPGHENELIFWFRDLGLIKIKQKCKNVEINDSCSLMTWSSSRVSDIYQWKCNNCQERKSIREGSIFDNVKCSFTEAIRIILGWCKGVDLDTMAKMLSIKKNVVGSLYRKICLIAEKYIRNNIEQWTVGGVGKIVLIDTYPEGCSNMKLNQARPILCLSEVGTFPQKYWLESLGSFNQGSNIKQLKKHISNTIKLIVKPGTILIVPSQSTLCSLEDISKLYHLYPTIIGTNSLARHDSGDRNLKNILEVIWKNVMDMCVEAQYYGPDYIQEFIIGNMWRRKYDSGCFERLIYEITG